LTEQFRSRAVEKTYWALVSGVAPPQGTCVDWIIKDERHRRMHIAAAGHSGAQEARLAFRRVAQWGTAQSGARSLLEVSLETGRKHQIRLQLSTRGLAILGDLKYGCREAFPAGIALHARRLCVEHPTQHGRLQIAAPLPLAWRKAGVDEAKIAR
jgi:23S rRNA pseudouridine1911/1915/1917 synthase